MGGVARLNRLSRTSHEVRGLKYGRVGLVSVACRRTSHEVRGLKFRKIFSFITHKCRTSHEVRGLKFTKSDLCCFIWTSHLTRGAWIEIERGF